MDSILHFIVTIFVNREERRLRAPWRLVANALILVIGVLGLNIVIGITATLISVMNGASLQDPQTVNAIATSPMVQALSSLATLAVMALSFWLCGLFVDRRPLADFGFHFNRRWWTDFGFGLFLGALLMALIFGVELAAGWVTITGWLQGTGSISFGVGMAVSVIVFLCVGFYEEMFSRGYQLRNLAEGLNFKFLSPRAALLIAYLISSSFFGLLHLGNPNSSLTSTLYLVGAGLFLGIGYLLTGELALPIGLHIAWNFFQGNVFGFPVSGSVTGATIIAIQQGGPEFLTGGAFGPEAGLIHPIAAVLGIILIFLWVRYSHGKAALQDRLAVYPKRSF